jgi:Fur family transcriptional regulator, iron response regulator
VVGSVILPLADILVLENVERSAGRKMLGSSGDSQEWSTRLKSLSRLNWYDTTAEIKATLRHLGVKPSRPRIALAKILFGKGERHISAEMLFEEARDAHLEVSLATVYNVLRDFTDAGLLRHLTIASKSYYDTNSELHHHFYFEESESLEDIPVGYLQIERIPAAGRDYEITAIDVIVRVRRTID